MSNPGRSFWACRLLPIAIGICRRAIRYIPAGKAGDAAAVPHAGSIPKENLIHFPLRLKNWFNQYNSLLIILSLRQLKVAAHFRCAALKGNRVKIPGCSRNCKLIPPRREAVVNSRTTARHGEWEGQQQYASQETCLRVNK